MANVSTWRGVTVNVQSAIAAAETIDSISKASTAVVGFSGTAPANGDYINLQIQGMDAINNTLARVANVGAGTFELEGIDSTTFGDFVSGTYQVATLGTSVSTFRGLSASGGEASEIDITTIHDDIDKSIPGNSSAISYSFDALWDPTDPGSQALKAFSDAGTVGAVLFGFKNGNKVAFLGSISANLVPVGNAGEVVTSPVTVTISGRITTYAS